MLDGLKQNKRNRKQFHCNIPNCDRPHFGKGFCNLHYHRWYKYGDPLREEVIPTLKERLEKFIISKDGCWEVRTGDAVGDGDKYYRITVRRRKILAHRVAYEAYIGDIPDGMLVLHKCDNRHCVNPDHLYLGGHSENMKDMWQRNSTRQEHPLVWYRWNKNE